MLDMLSYILGFLKGKRCVELSGDSYTYADDGNGNITITEA